MKAAKLCHQSGRYLQPCHSITCDSFVTLSCTNVFVVGLVILKQCWVYSSSSARMNNSNLSFWSQRRVRRCSYGATRTKFSLKPFIFYYVGCSCMKSPGQAGPQPCISAPVCIGLGADRNDEATERHLVTCCLQPRNSTARPRIHANPDQLYTEYYSYCYVMGLVD